MEGGVGGYEREFVDGVCLCALVKRAVRSRGRSAWLVAAVCATPHFIPCC